MNRTYHYEILRNNGTIYQSREYSTIEECVEECKLACEDYGIEYCDPEVRLYLTDDFGKTSRECTSKGEPVA